MTELHTETDLPLPLRDPSALDIRFKRNDPRRISHQYKGANAATWRKPNVIITSRTSARDAVAKGGKVPKSNSTHKRKREDEDEDDDDEEDTDDEHGQGEKEYESAPTAQGKFGWQDVLSCSEFKRVSKVLKCAPQSSYEDTDRKVTLPANHKDLDLPVDSSNDSGPASTQSSSKAPGSLPNSNDCRGAKKRKMDSVENKQGSLSVAKVMMENRKKAKSSDTPSKSANLGAGQSQEALSARAQCASYALEMMSYSIGVHHAITLFFSGTYLNFSFSTCLMSLSDTHMWIFYFDRQGILQSDGIDFIQDLPRFLVLLLAFQRFELRDWGVIPELNPSPSLVHDPRPPPPPRKEPMVRTRAASSAPTAEGLAEAQFKARATVIEEFGLDLKTTLDINWKWDDPDDPKTSTTQETSGAKNKVDPTNVTLKPRSFVSHQPHSLAGRATAVIDAFIPGLEREVVCKISNPEVQRTNEGDILREIYDQCDKHDASMKKHVPEMLLYGDIQGSLTNRVRSMVGIWDWRGHRSMRFMVLIKVHPLTALVGQEFVRAWLEAVKCTVYTVLLVPVFDCFRLAGHAFLWDHGIAHGDPSLWNLMYSAEHQCVVLGDYDLAILLGRPRVQGTDRTGTVTFMAIDLLNKKYWDGLIKRQYHHELEAFIWVLPFVFLRYQDRAAVPNTIVEEWMTSDYTQCHKGKSSFLRKLREHRDGEDVQPDFQEVWWIADELLFWLDEEHFRRQAQLRPRRQGKNEVDPRGNTPEEPALLTRARFVQKLTEMGGLEDFNDILISLCVATPA